MNKHLTDSWWTYFLFKAHFHSTVQQYRNTPASTKTDSSSAGQWNCTNKGPSPNQGTQSQAHRHTKAVLLLKPKISSSLRNCIGMEEAAAHTSVGLWPKCHALLQGVGALRKVQCLYCTLLSSYKCWHYIFSRLFESYCETLSGISVE